MMQRRKCASVQDNFTHIARERRSPCDPNKGFARWTECPAVKTALTDTQMTRRAAVSCVHCVMQCETSTPRTPKHERRTTTSTYYHTCPHCGAHLDPGERCDCKRAFPGGHQYGNRTSTETGQVRKPDGCKKCTHAKSAPVQIVHPNLPGLPEIVFIRSKQQPDPGQIELGSK